MENIAMKGIMLCVAYPLKVSSTGVGLAIVYDLRINDDIKHNDIIIQFIWRANHHECEEFRMVDALLMIRKVANIVRYQRGFTYI